MVIHRTAARLRGAAAAAAARAAAKNSDAAVIRSKKKQKIPLCWLDLRGAGLSVLERLCLEECILQKEEQQSTGRRARHWAIAGNHEPVRHKYLHENDAWKQQQQQQSWNNVVKEDGRPSWDVDATTRNEAAAIVLGIGGKPDQLLHLDLVRNDNVLTLKRFSGGGTVVLDYDSIWTTLIGRREELVSEVFPRPIMQWSADAIFGPMFERLAAMQESKSSNSNHNISSKATMVLDTKSCGVESSRIVTVKTIRIPPDDDSSSMKRPAIPKFQLREHDYVLGERKMGGNAQSIGKTGFLHHTSFLWDFQHENMEYLSLPAKRPEYRGDRSHNDFLVKLKDVYPHLKKGDFYTALADTCRDTFDVESVSVREAMAIVEEQGGMKAWFEKGSRTKVLRDL